MTDMETKMATMLAGYAAALVAGCVVGSVTERCLTAAAVAGLAAIGAYEVTTKLIKLASS